MVNNIRKQLDIFNEDRLDIESNNVDINNLISVIKDKIIQTTNEYLYSEEKDKLKNMLIRYYNLLFYYQAKVNGINKAYLLDKEISELPDIYLVDEAPCMFEVDEELLSNIDVNSGLTMEEAHELLKWTVNNTRNNLNIDEANFTGIDGDVYGNSSLDGACGFSQFSSLYPLQQLGLEVTINNIGAIDSGRHAYGTVIIPVIIDGEIVKKRFLIDCTYRQFFTIPFNVITRYLNSFPFAGFYIYSDSEQVKFAKELLRNGFVEGDIDNLKRYLKPFFSSTISLEEIDSINDRFNELDVLNIIDNKQEEFDYTEEEFVQGGFNLDFVYKNKTSLHS